MTKSRYNKKIKTFYSPKQVSKKKVGFSRSPEKPKLLLAYLLNNGLDKYFEITEDFAPFEKEDFYLAHTKKYVKAFFDGQSPLASSNGLQWNPDFAETVRYTNASLYEAIRHAILNPDDITFSPTSGFHHATPSGGQGFCTFSGQVIAARKIWKEFGKRALFLDYDGHFGNSIEDSREMFPDLNECIFLNVNPGYDDIEWGGNPLNNSWVGDVIRKGWENRDWDYLVFCHGADSHEWDDLRGDCTTAEWVEAAVEVYSLVDELNKKSSRKETIPVTLSLFGGYREDDYESVLSLHTADLVKCINILLNEKVDYTPVVKPSKPRYSYY